MRVLLAGGGTAGHVNPLLATARELVRRDPDTAIQVLGTAEGLETRLVPMAGFDLATIPKVPFPRSLSAQMIKFPGAFRGALGQVARILEDFRPDVVVGFGGYVSTPAYLAAHKADVPIVVHEANARPGMANKLGARYAARVAVTFSETKLAHAERTGLPMRPALAELDRPGSMAAAREELGLDLDRPTLLVSGGSLGAQRLNQVMVDVAGELLAAGAQVLHLTGRGKAEDLQASLSRLPGAEHYHVLEYLDRMELALAAADLAVERAGAGSVTELACASLPSVLVPLPIGNGEQRLNAADLVGAGAAILVDDADLTAWAPGNLLAVLTDRERLDAMAEAASGIAIRDGAARLADLIEAAAAPGGADPAAAAAPAAPSAEAPAPAAPAPGEADPASLGHVHLMGIGGVGMAAVAELLAAEGSQVSGCDGKDSPMLTRLRSLGITTCVGHDPSHLDGVDTLVVSSAIRAHNPELVAARAAGIPVLHRSQGLAAVAASRRLIAVAGTHGKTTTSAMTACALAGSDPSFAIGAEVLPLGTGAHLGGGDVMVIEADESDESFLNYEPLVAVVTNVEADHLDYYGTAEAVTRAFHHFVRRIRPGGLLITCADDPGGVELADFARVLDVTVVTYGRTADADVVASAGIDPTALRLEGKADGADVSVELSVRQPGWHMKLDAAAAFLAAIAVGTPAGEAADGIGAFQGTGRRFELKAEVRGVRVYDDYAHHPTEIRAMLHAAREVTPGRLLVVFQPHLYSRTEAFAEEFADALALADEVWVADVYGAREDPVPGITGETVTRHMDPETAHFAPDKDAIPEAVAAAAQTGDVIVTVGAGDVTALAGEIERELTQGPE